MKIFRGEQLSPSWWKLKVGTISGTRFGKVISNKANSLEYTLANEIIDNNIIIDDLFVTDAIQYGLDNEDTGLELASEVTGIKYAKAGAIISDFCDNHIASPDGLNEKLGIVAEVKCTMDGAIHLKRINEGIDSNYLPQCINYFAVSDEVKEVHFISYCGFKELRPIHVIKLTRATEVKYNRKLVSIDSIVIESRKKINELNNKVKQIVESYKF